MQDVQSKLLNDESLSIYLTASVSQLELISGRQQKKSTLLKTQIALQDENDKKEGSLIQGEFAMFYSLSIGLDYSFCKITLHSSKFCCCYI